MADKMASTKHDATKNEVIFNRIFVLGGKELKESDWERIFSPFGKIVRVFITPDRNTGKPKGITYITFSKTSECCKAVEEMNGKYVEGLEKPIKVIIATDRKSPQVKSGVEETSMLKKLFVMFPKDQSDSDLKEDFKQYGDVEYVRVVKSKRQNTPRNLAYVKFYHQSSAAKAYEECERDYKPIFADVKFEEPDRDSHFDDRGYGGSGGRGYDRGHDRDYDRGGRGGGRMDSYEDRFPLRGSFRHGHDNFDDRGGPNRFGVAPLEVVNDMHRGGGGFNESKTIEICVSGRVSENHVKRLCDVAPGLVNYRCDAASGVAYAEYTSSSCARYAQEKLNSFEYPIGCPLNVKLQGGLGGGGDILGDTAANLNMSLQDMGPGGGIGKGGVHALVESITRATAVLQQAGIAGTVGDLGIGSGKEEVAWCNVPLPYKKPFASRDAMVETRLFIVSQAAFPDRYLEEAFCRFGDLISVYFMPGKGYGYAKFANRDAAFEAINTLHGQQICGNRIKVMEAEPPRHDDGEFGGQSKRMRSGFD